MHRRVARNLLWTMVSDGLIRLFIVFTPIYVARTLSPGSFGLFAIAQAVGQYSAVLMDFAANSSYAIREIAQNKQESTTLITRFMTLRVVAALVGTTIGSVLVALPLPVDADSRTVIRMSLLYGVAYAFFPDWAFRALEHMKYMSVGYVTVAASYWCLAILLIRSDHDVAAAVVAWVLAYALGGGALTVLLRVVCGPELRLRPPSMRDFRGWTSSVQFTLAGLLGISLSQGPLLLLGAFSGPTSAGLFSASLRIALIFSAGAPMVAMSTYPILASLRTQPLELDRVSSALIRWMLLVSAPIAVVGTVWADRLAATALGPQYTHASTLLAIMAWTIPLSFLACAFEYTVLARGNEGKRLIANAAALAVMLAVGLPLVITYHEVGASLAYLISLACLLIALYGTMYGVRVPDLGRSAEVFKAVMLMCTLYVLLMSSRVLQLEIFGAGLAILVYLAASGMLHLVHPAEVAILRAHVARRLCHSDRE